MESLQRTHQDSSYGSQSTRGYQGEGTRQIDDCDYEVRTEAYKVNWKIAIPLFALIVTIPFGLLYLAGIAILNCLGGKQVKVPRQTPVEQRAIDRSAETRYQASTILGRSDRRGESTTYGTLSSERSKGGAVRSKGERTTASDPLLPKDKKKSSKRTDSVGVDSERRLRREKKKDSKRANRSQTGSSSKREARSTRASNTTSARTTASTPAPIQEKRAPIGRTEEKAVLDYMGVAVINGSKVGDKESLIRSIKIRAKTATYDKTGEDSQSLQKYLSFFHRPSYEAFMKAHPYLA